MSVRGNAVHVLPEGLCQYWFLQREGHVSAGKRVAVSLMG